MDTSISLFKLVIVCGSEDDSYVPAYSACIDYSGRNQSIARMASNLRSNIRNLHQIYVKFDGDKKGTVWDRFLSRRVHINFLDDDPFLHFLLGQYFSYF